MQLRYGGGFYANMELIDLSTPVNVRFDTEDVLHLLKEKIGHCAIKSIDKFVLPNLKELTGGDVAKNILGGFCGALCGENTENGIKIKEVVLRCDKVSSNFTANLEWIDSFLSCYNLDTVNVRNLMFNLNVIYIFTDISHKVWEQGIYEISQEVV